MATERGLCNTTSAIVLSTMGIIPNKLRGCLKVHSICPVLYILMQKAVTIQFSLVQFILFVHPCSLKFFGRKMKKKFFVSGIFYLFIYLFCSFNPATWGHSPQDIEHVKICVA